MSSSENRKSALDQKSDRYTYPTYHSKNNLTIRRSLRRSQAKRKLDQLENHFSVVWKQVLQWLKKHKGLIVISLLTLFLWVTHPWSPDAVGIIRLKNDVAILFSIIFEVAKIGLIFIVFGLLILLISWLSGKGAGIIVLPFENLTGSTEAYLDGKGITNLIIAELHRIRYLHHDTPEVELGIRLENLNFPTLAPAEMLDVAPLCSNDEDFENQISQMGTISFADSQIHLGSLLIALRRLWPFGDSGKVVSGSIQKYGEDFRLIARIEGYEVSAWDARKYGSTPEDLPELVRELAFKVVIHLHPALQVTSWKALYWFTEALAKYRNYRQSGKLEELNLAFNCCCEAMGEEKEYDKLSNLFCRIGVSFFKERKLDNAKRSFLKSLEIDPENAYAYNGLGNVYRKENKISDAFEAYNKAIYWDEICPYPHNGLGHLYRRIGDYDQAEKSYFRAIQIDPSLWPPYVNLGIIAQLTGDPKQSLTFFKKAMQKSHKDSGISNVSNLHDCLGMAYLMSHDLEQAEHELNAAVCLDPKGYIQHGNLGLLFTLKNNAQKAELHFRQAVDLGLDREGREFDDELLLSFYRIMLHDDSVVYELQEMIARADYLHKGSLKELLIDVGLVEKVVCHTNHDLTDLVQALESRIKDLDKVTQAMNLSVAESSEQRCLAKSH